MTEGITYRGGQEDERLYLVDKEFTMPDGRRVVVHRTDILPPAENDDLVARNLGRNMLLGPFVRPSYTVLDFPCGSGYVAPRVRELGGLYCGVDRDDVTIEYARRQYGGTGVQFIVGDLTNPDLLAEHFNTIQCIEGLEHIRCDDQIMLVAALYQALKPGGILIVSSPESIRGVSGPNPKNSYHLHELTKDDFVALLHTSFPPERVEIVTQVNKMHTGDVTRCFYAFCHKPES